MSRSPIFIVSGGVGFSGEQLVRTALAQFPDAEVPVILVPRVQQVEQLTEIVARAVNSDGTIVHTLVDATLRTHLLFLAAEQQVAAIDLIGPVLARLKSVLGQHPIGQPGRYREQHQSRFARVDAIEFALAHDDGQHPQGWTGADILLIGVSRVGKTPISIYLAVLGWKTANLPLVKEIPPPIELFQLDRRRVVGLTIDLDHLLSHRRQRQLRLGMPSWSPYTDPAAVCAELETAYQVCRQGGFQLVDVTDKPIELLADEITKHIPTLRTGTG